MSKEKVERQGANIPTVSVLTPVYNGEDYLKRAVNSVLNQTYKDFEIILIDDGSIDTTPEICDEYGQKYDFIHVFHQKNSGIGKTRLNLLGKASGRYIFWLDQDDYYEATLLEKAVNSLERNNADIVYWNYAELISVNGKVVEDRRNDMSVEYWRIWNIWGLAPMVFKYAARRELWENLEKFPDDVDLTEDVWFTAQVVSKTQNIVSLGEEVLYYYDRTNLKSIMHTRTASSLSKIGLSLYLNLKRNINAGLRYENLQLRYKNLQYLKFIRRHLIDAYCFNCINPELTDAEIKMIKSALKDLDILYPQKKTNKFYFLQFCVIHGIDFYCRIYAKSRIRKIEREKEK